MPQSAQFLCGGARGRALRYRASAGRSPLVRPTRPAQAPDSALAWTCRALRKPTEHGLVRVTGAAILHMDNNTSRLLSNH